MRGFIVVLVLCGIYSSHSASVGVSESSPCANRADGSFLPVTDDCSGFLMCLKGETIRSSCGNTLHFDPVGKQCVEISMSVCVSGKKVITSVSSEKKEDQAVMEVKETKPQIIELKAQEIESKAPVEEVEVQQVALKLVVKPQLEEVNLQQVPLKPEVQPQLEEVKLQQVPLKVVLTPRPEEVRLQLQTPELKPLEAQPQPTELKPESKPKPEEKQLLQMVPQSKQIEQEQLKAVAQPEEAKPQQAVALKDACIGLTVGSFIASRTNCHEYYVCLGNKMILKVCPNELHFNPDVRSCTAPSLANCVAEPESDAEVKEIPAEEKLQELIQPESNVEVVEIPAEEKPLELETSEIVSVTADAMCSGKDNGVMLPVPGSCTKFLACLQQDTYELSCGVGHFDPATSTCVLAKDSGCVEEKVTSDLDVLVEPVIDNVDEQLTKTGTVSKLISASNNVASLEITAPVIQTLITDQSVGNLANLGKNNADASNTGVASDANTVLTSQHVEMENTELGSSNSYTVSGGNLLVNDIIVPIKQSGLQVNKEEISPIDQLDIDVSRPEIVVDANAESTVGIVEAEKATKGISIDSNNVNVIINSQTSVDDQEFSNNIGGQRLSIPDEVEEENTAVIVAVVNEESTRMCVGVPSGTLFPRIGNCEEFLTCESDIAYVAACPDGLHYNALLKACDWPESAGCA